MYLNKKIKILERKKSILLDYVTAPGTNGFSSFGSDVWPAIAKLFINMYIQGDSKKSVISVGFNSKQIFLSNKLLCKAFLQYFGIIML